MNAVRKESVGFLVDGEWLTDLVRQWFWDENRPYEDCEELLFSCMPSPDTDEMYHTMKQIMIDILEGRKKFVGINDFELVDDSLNIRYIFDKLSQERHKRLITEIENDIINNGIKYVDKYSTVKSIKSAEHHNVKTAEECSVWFLYSDNDTWKVKVGEFAYPLPAAESVTRGGLWLFDRPELIAKCTDNGRIPVGSDEYYENIYNETKDNTEFDFRSNFYKGSLRKKVEDDRYIQSLVDGYIEEQDENKNIIYMSTEYFQNERKRRKDIDTWDYEMSPDDINLWTGLIDPDGNFYSCSFGAHNLKAYYLVYTHPEKFGADFRYVSHKTDKDYILYEDKIKSAFSGIDVSNALDFIRDKGWCATRYQGITGEYIDAPKYHKPTQRQIDTLFDAVIKHGVNQEILKKFF